MTSDIMLGYLGTGAVVLVAKVASNHIEKSPRYSDGFKKRAKIIIAIVCILCFVAIIALRTVSRKIAFQ